MKKLIKILIIIFIILIILISSLGYAVINGFSIFGLKSKNSTVVTSTAKTLTNPAAGLTLDEAVKKFDKSFIIYLLASIKAYNLHNPPLSSDTPKIQLDVGNTIYNAEIVNNGIKIGNGEISKKDIIIKTSTEEAVKMVMDKNYISRSFNNGNSQIELVASKLKLVSKGYWDIYNELKG